MALTSQNKKSNASFRADPNDAAPQDLKVRASNAAKDVIGEFVDISSSNQYKRQVIIWKTPTQDYIEMYINPENFTESKKKIINTQKTKGGFIIQYGGEELGTIELSGSTGSSGIEGINVLDSIYRAEQYGYDVIAEQLQSRSYLPTFSSPDSNLNNLGNTFINAFQQPLPTLASLAANVEMFYQGKLYRGYFTDFRITESADKPGLFDYNLSFTYYASLGIRRNFMPWHKQPDGTLTEDTNLTFNSTESLTKQLTNGSNLPSLSDVKVSNFFDVETPIQKSIKTSGTIQKRKTSGTKGRSLI